MMIATQELLRAADRRQTDSGETALEVASFSLVSCAPGAASVKTHFSRFELLDRPKHRLNGGARVLMHGEVDENEIRLPTPPATASECDKYLGIFYKGFLIEISQKLAHLHASFASSLSSDALEATFGSVAMPEPLRRRLRVLEPVLQSHGDPLVVERHDAFFSKHLDRSRAIGEFLPGS